jgi:hypothetical protein
VLPAASCSADRVWIDPLGFLGLGAATLVTGAPLPVPVSRQVTMTFTVLDDQALIGPHIDRQGVDLDPRAGTARFTGTSEETFAR